MALQKHLIYMSPDHTFFFNNFEYINTKTRYGEL